MNTIKTHRPGLKKAQGFSFLGWLSRATRKRVVTGDPVGHPFYFDNSQIIADETNGIESFCLWVRTHSLWAGTQGAWAQGLKPSFKWPREVVGHGC